MTKDQRLYFLLGELRAFLIQIIARGAFARYGQTELQMKDFIRRIELELNG